jgi:ATPase family associated with various cellular activities (AAA)
MNSTKNEPYIANRFQKEMMLHLVKNTYMPEANPAQGKPGFGKTHQLEHVLKKSGVKVFHISAGQLESPNAGEPAALIRTNYLNAGKAVDKGDCIAAAIVINDVETGLGQFGSLTQYTVNTQTASGQLMHLADFPTEVEGRLTRRIPIFMTGNDLTKLYSPLIRLGRMTTFEWSPTVDEMTEIVWRIFPEIDKNDCYKLANDFSGCPTVFFSQMRAKLADESLWEAIQQVGVDNILPVLSKKQGKPPLNYGIINYISLSKIGEVMMEEINKTVNHLEKNKNG